MRERAQRGHDPRSRGLPRAARTSARRGRGTEKSHKNSSRATRAFGFEILAHESSKDYKHIEIYRNRSRRYDFPRSLEPAPWRCESERSADSTLTAEGYREPQERAREEVEGPRKNSSRATMSRFEVLARESSKDFVYIFIIVVYFLAYGHK